MKFLCGCGTYNYNLNDWLCHFKYRGFVRGMYLLLITRVEIWHD